MMWRTHDRSDSFPRRTLRAGAAAIQSGDIRTVIELCADDVVFEFPFAPPGRPGKVAGKQALGEYLSAIPSRIQFDRLSNLEMHQTLNPDVAIVEMTAVGCVKPNRRALRDVLRRSVDREQWPDCALPRLLETR